MTDPDLEQIGDALVRVAHTRAAARTAPRRVGRRRIGLLATAAVVIVAALAIIGSSLRGGQGTVASAAQGGFTQYAFAYRNGGTETGGCAVAACDRIGATLHRQLASAQLLTTLGDARSARLLSANGRVREIGVAANTSGSTTFSFDNTPPGPATIELLDTSGRVIQTLHP
jgi:hypothetical protein